MIFWEDSDFVTAQYFWGIALELHVITCNNMVSANVSLVSIYYIII